MADSVAAGLRLEPEPAQGHKLHREPEPAYGWPPLLGA